MGRTNLFLNVVFFSFFIFVKSTVFAQNCSCKYTVPPQTHEINGDKLNLQPGDTICLDADIIYGNLKFTSITGSKEKPVVITNCGGRVRIISEGAFGVKFTHSKFFKISGSGTAGEKYGIAITTSKGFFLTMESFSTDFEISFIEIAGIDNADTLENKGFAGIGVKTKPFCDGSANRGTWDMYDVKIHDNYIHHTGGEGLYVGHGFYNGRIEKGCSDTTYSHSIIGLRIYNNIIENTGYDGIQVKNADKDCEIYQNTIKNYGTRKHGAHNEGIFIGEGTSGKLFNNWIENGTGNGIQFQGMGNNDIFNNVIINAGENGFYAAGGKHAYRIPEGHFHIFNNTIIKPTEYAFIFYDNEGGAKRVINNIFVTSEKGFTKKGAKVELSTNLITGNIEELKFTNIQNMNFQLTAASPAVNTGMNLSIYGITFDFGNKIRPNGGKFDIGAIEF